MSQSESIQLVNESGRLRGFANLLSKENSLWWGTRKWWTQSLIWFCISNGLMILVLWISPALDSNGSFPPPSETMSVFLMTHGAFTTIGVIILSQSAIVEEKRSGTAQWILSNPVSRSSFIISKLLGNALGIMVVLVLLQSGIAYLQISLRNEFFPPFVPYLESIGLLSLTLLFYLTLSFMLGTIFSTRGPVIGISIGVLVLQSILRQLASTWVPWLTLVMPDTLMQLTSPIVKGQPLPAQWPIPIISTTLMSMFFVLVAIWRFNREEF
jgi:ABC-2 type transport system permease protein